MKPSTVDEAVALLRAVAEDRRAEAEQMAEREGAAAAEFTLNEAIFFAAAATIIERGEYAGFTYEPLPSAGTEAPDRPG